MASGRSNTEFTAFVSNLPFNVSEDELREKFKHVRYVLFCRCHSLYVILTLSLCHSYPLFMSFLSSLCNCYPPCVSLLAPLCHHHFFLIISFYHYVLVVIGYSVGILLISDWLKNIFEDEHVSLLM